jgi:hypothetical protein
MQLVEVEMGVNLKEDYLNKQTSQAVAELKSHGFLDIVG